MANRIEGITVEIGGDTTKLSKTLECVNKNIKTTQTQLKDVEKLLKLDGISGTMMNGGESTTVINNVHNDNSRTVNQNNHSPKSLSRLEIYRTTRNAVNV